MCESLLSANEQNLAFKSCNVFQEFCQKRATDHQFKMDTDEVINAFQEKMVDAGNQCETHIYKGSGHGFFHIQKGGRKIFEDVLIKADAFLVKNNYLSGNNTAIEWTAKSIANLPAPTPKKKKKK